MKSDILGINKGFCFDKKRDTSKSEIKKLKNNANLVQNLNNKRYKGSKKLGITGKNLKLRNFAKSNQKSIETLSNHSGVSRKSRLLSASSKGSINLKEFSQLKLENQKFRKIIAEMVQKFTFFKNNFTEKKVKWNTGESGSSVVWKDRTDPSNTKVRHREASNTDPELVNFEIENEKDHIIKKLKSKVSEKDRRIAELEQQLKEAQTHK